jgi:hypothetical protein
MCASLRRSPAAGSGRTRAGEVSILCREDVLDACPLIEERIRGCPVAVLDGIDFFEFEIVLKLVQLTDGGLALGLREACVVQLGSEFGDPLIRVHGPVSPLLSVSLIEDIRPGNRRSERVKAAQRRRSRATGEPKFSGARERIGRRSAHEAPVNFGGTVAP